MRRKRKRNKITKYRQDQFIKPWALRPPSLAWPIPLTVVNFPSPILNSPSPVVNYPSPSYPGKLPGQQGKLP